MGQRGLQLFRARYRQHGNHRPLWLRGKQGALAQAAARWRDPLVVCHDRTRGGQSSDATNIATRIERQGDDYVINGHKWWISGASDPRCAIYIVMGKTDPDAPRHAQQSMVLVPANTPGLRIVRPLNVMGYDDAPHGHVEMFFDNVRVPVSNILLGEGRGFEIAQGRLGPGASTTACA
jgi:alkylation response protein AidB-like acyl-CoA dehydrogenase